MYDEMDYTSDDLGFLWDTSENETVPVWNEVAQFWPAPQPLREASVSISVAQPGSGQAWILTPSIRPHVLGHWFIPGTRVEIFASPAPGFAFSHWVFTNPTTRRSMMDRRAAMAFTVCGHLTIQAHFVRLAPPPPRPPLPPLPPPRPPHPPHPPMPPRPPRPPVPPPRPPMPPPARPPARPPIMPPALPVPPIGILQLDDETDFHSGFSDTHQI